MQTLLKRRLRLGGGLLALGVVALFAGHPPPARGDRTAGAHNLESHQYKDSRKCLLTAAALCGGKRAAVTKRFADKRQHVNGGGGGGDGGGGGGGGDRDNDLDQNVNFDYNYDGGGGGGGGGGGDGDVGQDGGPDGVDDYYEPDPPIITDPRDRMLPVIYNPRPMYVPPAPIVPPDQQQQQQPPPYNRYDEDVSRISPFEVPIIECPPTEDGFERFACPTPDKEGRFRCIDDHVLCDGYIDCPNGDDEDRKNCFFFKTTKAHLDILADALLRWARGR